MFDIKQVKDLLVLALLNMGIVDYLAEPVKKKFPEVDYWWLRYVSLATGIAISMVSGLNAFPPLQPLVGGILTGILVGGGSKIIYDLLDYGGDTVTSMFG